MQLHLAFPLLTHVRSMLDAQRLMPSTPASMCIPQDYTAILASCFFTFFSLVSYIDDDMQFVAKTTTHAIRTTHIHDNGTCSFWIALCHMKILENNHTNKNNNDDPDADDDRDDRDLLYFFSSACVLSLFSHSLQTGMPYMHV